MPARVREPDAVLPGRSPLTGGEPGGAGTFRDCVVLCAANNWDGVRLHDRQLAERLASHAPVLYVDPPVSAVSRYRRAGRRNLDGPRLRAVGPRLARLTPVVAPGLERPGVARVNRRLLARAIRRAVGALGGSTAVLVESSVLVPALGRCGESSSAYWAQDDFVGSADLLGLSAERLRAGEEELIRRADVVVAANPVIADRIREQRRNVHLVPYGCDAELFGRTPTTPPAPDVTTTEPTAFFMGHVGDRIDADVMRAVADRGVPVLVVGPRHFRSDLRALAAVFERPNVMWAGPREFEDLPSYLAHGHVGLLPYNHSPFNVGSFPLKVLEYLAAGLPVVSTDLPAVRWLDAGDHINIHDDPVAYADAVVRRLRTPRTESGDAARRDFAAKHTWERRAAAFAEAIGLAGTAGTATADGA